MTSDKFIRNRLAGLRAELITLSEQSADARAIVTLDQQSVGRLSRMDALQTQAMANAAEARRSQEIVRIDAAFKRVDEGTYGECLRCGEEIEPARLDFDPAATQCAGCARRNG
ncbi:MAG: TraR/DksA family transcriptional regulator [Alphaproteobacteria bacterium]